MHKHQTQKILFISGCQLSALVWTLIHYQESGLKEVTGLPQQWDKPRGPKINPQPVKSMILAKLCNPNQRKKKPVVPAIPPQRSDQYIRHVYQYSIF
jgi:hypothetical protein